MVNLSVIRNAREDDVRLGAEDARRHRQVALKFVSAELTGDADALRRCA